MEEGNLDSVEKKEECQPTFKDASWLQVFTILAVSLGPFTNGLLFVWSSPFTLVITKDKVNYNITEEEASYFIVIQPVGMIVGSLFYYKVADLLGRKKAVMCLALPHITTWLITIFATTKWEFYAARFIAGLGDTCLFCSVPPYIAEISNPTIRGKWGNTPTLSIYAGQLCITVLGSYLNVQTTAYICICIPIVFFTIVTFLPESPYQLIRDGNYDKARQVIKKLTKKSDIEQDFLSMKKDIERQISESGTWKDIITIRSNRRALRAGIFLRFSQQLSGISVFSTYAQPIFEKAGGSFTPQASSMIFLGLACFLNVVFSPAVERYGRKFTYFYSILLCGFISLGMAIYFFFDFTQIVSVSSIGWFPLTGLLIWTVFYSFGLGLVPTLMLGELFSASIKSKGLSILTTFFGISVFLTTIMFHLLTSNIGLYSPFLVYGVLCLISAVLTLKWVPETKGKTLEEIQQYLKK